MEQEIASPERADSKASNLVLLGYSGFRPSVITHLNTTFSNFRG